MDKSLNLLLQYPLIRMKNTESSDVIIFDGNIFVSDKDYSISIRQTRLSESHQKYELEHLDNSKRQFCTEVKELLQNKDFHDIIDVLDTIRDHLKLRNTKKTLENHSPIYRKVLYEYSEFTKFFLNLKSCKLKEDLTTIFVSICDEKNRAHSVEITVDYSKNSMEIFQISSFDLPEKDQTADFLKPNDSLTALFDQYLAQIEILQPYFDVMEEFDRNCSILDPENPRRKDFYRRIWLGENISIIITVDPYKIYLRPDVKFLGPDRVVESYTVRLNENLGNWNRQNGIFQAILDLLGLKDFPKKDIQEKSVNLLVEYGECSICFCLRLNEKLPEVICPNKSCEKLYHNECLYCWLVSLNAKRVFNHISGNCPNCEKTITCPILD